MNKIGIYIFTDVIKKRGLSHDAFDNKKYYGLKRIVMELTEAGHKIEYCSGKTLNKYSHVLISIISYYDAINYIQEIAYRDDIKTKIIVGGAYVLNYKIFKNAWAVVIGRAENMINSILDGVKLENVIYTNKITGKYKVGIANEFIVRGGEKEKSVGCGAKCYFCQYAWKNKYIADNNMQGYHSSYSEQEDYIQSLRLDKNGRYVTAIDGSTEATRQKVFKKITDSEIAAKLTECIENDIAGMIKIYNIVGYPWEQKYDISDFLKIVTDIDGEFKNNKNKMTIYLTNTHFVPKLLTPMEDLSINRHNFRLEINKNLVMYRGNYYKVTNSAMTTTPTAAMEEYIVDRCEELDVLLIKKIMCSKKYIGLDGRNRLKVLDQYFGKYINGYRGDYLIEYPHKIESIKKRFA